MRLSTALVACNENMRYLQFWPLVKKAWYEVVGIPCIMVYVAEILPDILKADPAVIHFKPIQGWSTATQAQVIRLLYPALLKADGAILLSDMDMIPMQSEFFHSKIESAKPNQFVCLRGINEEIQQIYMCYVAATPSTFSRMFNIKQLDDIYERFNEFATIYKSDGLWDGVGWFSDQLILYKTVKSEPIENLYINPYIDIEKFPRLDRGAISEWVNPDESLHTCIKSGFYIDFHLPFHEIFHARISELYSIIPKCQIAPF